MSIQKWEYMVVHHPLYPETYDAQADRSVRTLDELGMQNYLDECGAVGWELVQRTEHGVLFFKRPLQ